MMMVDFDLGVLGLGTMGGNLARNFHNSGFKVSVYNRTTEKMEAFIEEFGDDSLVGFKELADFVASLKRPRKVVIMVPAGVIDQVIDEVLLLLEAGDAIMDGGNTYYKGTVERQLQLAEMQVGLLGCGISGGEEGALRGPSLMPGASKEVYELFEPYLKAAAAKDFSGGDCVTFVGDGGAGHYVKMVHNGIEYADMQVLAEAYLLLTEVAGFDLDKVSAVFNEYNSGRLASFLMEIAVDVAKQKDDQTEGFLLPKIYDSAGQKGTGRWTAMEALELGVPLGTIMAAVNARNLSANKELRSDLAKVRTEYPVAEAISGDFVKLLESALYGARLVAFAQGFELMRAADKEYGFGLDFAEISRIWQGGCIIRGEVLRLFEDSWQESQDKHLFEFAKVRKELQELEPEWRRLVSIAQAWQIPVPVLSSALTYVDAIFRERSGAEMIQGLRDNFGAHTYQRVDMEGVFHTQWGK